MFIAEPLIVRMGALFASIGETRVVDSCVEEGTVDRKLLRILLDAFMEQSIGNIVGEKPLNVAHALQIIRDSSGEVTDSSDRRVLETLREVLVEFRVVQHAGGANDNVMLKGELERAIRGLLIAACNHPDCAKSRTIQQVMSGLLAK